MSKTYPTKLASYPKWWQFKQRRIAKRPVTVSISSNPSKDGVTILIDPALMKESK